MMKYFDHDVDAHKDEKIIALRHKHGSAAVDAYWTLLEMIYRDETQIKPSENPQVLVSLSIFLMTDEKSLKAYIQSMVEYGLLIEAEDGKLISPRAEGKIESYQHNAFTSRENGKKGGRPSKKPVQGCDEGSDESGSKPNENPEETQQVPKETQDEPARGDKEKEKKKEKNKDISTDVDILSGKPADSVFDEVIGYLNQKARKHFKASTKSYQKLISARLKEGYTLEDFKRVIDVKCAKWDKPEKPGGEDTRAWLNPETLFRPSNFDRYLNEEMPKGGRDYAKYDR